MAESLEDERHDVTSKNPIRVVFDLDGTLINSLDSLAAVGAKLTKELGRRSVSADEYEGFVGRGLAAQVIDLLNATGGLPDDGGRAAIERFHTIYADDPVTGVEEYPGARDALLALAENGCVLGVCTQKPEALARQILTALGHMPPISVIVGGDTLPGILKPDPKMLSRAADPLGSGPLVYVGDSEIDAQTAINAGVPFILTGWGIRSVPETDIHHDRLVETFQSLPDTVAQVLSAEVRCGGAG